MRIVLSALLVSLTIASAFVIYQTVPKVEVYTDCFRATNELYNQEGSLTRPARYNQMEICELNKPDIIEAALCYIDADKTVQASESNREIIMKIAQKMARNTKTIDEVIADHNKDCSGRQISIDPIRDIQQAR